VVDGEKGLREAKEPELVVARSFDWTLEEQNGILACFFMCISFNCEVKVNWRLLVRTILTT